MFGYVKWLFPGRPCGHSWWQELNYVTPLLYVFVRLELLVMTEKKASAGVGMDRRQGFIYGGVNHSK